MDEVLYGVALFLVLAAGGLWLISPR